MGILLLICLAILALPYLIRERLCHVLPLYATTATGRKLFDRQFQALVACCGFVGIVQFGIYVLVYVIKGLAVFWKGDCIDDTGLQLWCKICHLVSICCFTCCWCLCLCWLRLF